MKSVINSVKRILTSKTFIMFVVFSCVVMSNTFAQAISTLDSWGANILGIFSSGWIKALACVALIIEAIGMIVAGQQGGGGAIIKKFAPWIIGTVILLSASGITNYFMENLNYDDLNTGNSYLLPQENLERLA